MPVMDGPTATSKIRDMCFEGSVLGITGNVLAEDVSLFKAKGADYVLFKPVLLADIEACWSGGKD